MANVRLARQGSAGLSFPLPRPSAREAEWVPHSLKRCDDEGSKPWQALRVGKDGVTSRLEEIKQRFLKWEVSGPS